MAQQVPHTIEVEITPEGEIKATVKGVPGPKCGELSAFLDGLGTVVEDSHTPDYYRQQAAGNRVTTGRFA